MAFPMAFPMGFHGGTSAWRPMMMRRRATRSQAAPVRAARGPKPGPFWLGKRWHVTRENADFTDEIDDFGELWWFCQGTLLDFNEENEKNDDFTREHDNLIMDHGDLTRKCGENCDVGILPGETWDFTGKIAILNGEIWSLPGKTYDSMKCGFYSVAIHSSFSASSRRPTQRQAVMFSLPWRCNMVQWCQR